MKHATLLHIDPSQVSDAIQNNAVYHTIYDVIAYWP